MQEVFDDYYSIEKKASELGVNPWPNKFLSIAGSVETDDIGVVHTHKEKVAYSKLSENPGEWTQQIIKKFYKNNQWVDADDYYIKWNEFNNEKGCGVGTLTLEKNDKEAILPIIISNFELKPFDVYYDNKIIKPFTQMNLEKTLFSTQPGTKVEEAPKDVSKRMFNSTFAPRGGRRVYASIYNIDLLEDDVADFHAKIKDRSVLKTAQKNEAFLKVANDIINKLDTIDTIDEGKPKEKIACAVIVKDPSQGYSTYWKEEGQMKEKTAGYYDTYKFFDKNFGMEKEAVDEKIKRVDKLGLATVTLNKCASMLTDNLDVDKILNAARIITTDTTGEEVQGIAIPKVLKVSDGNVLGPTFLINDRRNIISYQEGIVGKKVSSDVKNVFERNIIQKIALNDTISFVWRDSKYNDYVALEPSRIVSEESIEGEGVLYTVVSTFGEMVPLLKMKGVVSPDFSRNNSYNAVIIPEEASIINLKNDYKPLETSGNRIKEAMFKEYSTHPISYSGETNEFDIEGIVKEASPNETLLALLEKGVDEKDALGVLKKTASKIRIKEEKVKEASQKDYSKLLKNLEKRKGEVIKIAAAITDEETLDKVLAINFMNERNVGKFHDAKEEYEATVQDLAGLLLASRLGDVGLEEATIKEAMNALQELIENMEGI